MSVPSNVTQLPDSGQRAWSVFEPALFEDLQRRGYSAETARRALAGIKPVFIDTQKRSGTHIVATDAESTIKKLNAWVQDLIIGLLVEIVKREAEVIQLRDQFGNSDDPRPPRAA